MAITSAEATVRQPAHAKIEIAHTLIRRCHDLSDVLTAISAAARLVVEHLESSESAIVAMIAFIDEETND